MNKLFLRNATSNDADIILSWANDYETRTNSFSDAMITREEHMRWFCDKLENPNCCFFIMTDGKTDIGQIRIDIADVNAMVSYSIEHSHRGMGYGTIIIRLAEEKMLERGDVTDMVAYVKAQNVASQRIFEKLGYTSTILDNGVIAYRKTMHKQQNANGNNIHRGGGTCIK